MQLTLATVIFLPLDEVSVGTRADCIVPTALVFLTHHGVLNRALGGHPTLLTTYVPGSTMRAGPLGKPIENADVGLGLVEPGHLLVDPLQEADIPFTVIHHLLQGFLIVLQRDSLPHIEGGLVLTFIKQQLGQILQAVAVEIEPPAGNYQGVHGFRLRDWVQVVLKTLSMEPLEVEPVPVVGDQLVRLLGHTQKLLNHVPVITLVPCQRMYFIFTFPFPTYTDDGLFPHNVIRVQPRLLGSLPEQAHVGASFDIPVESSQNPSPSTPYINPLD